MKKVVMVLLIVFPTMLFAKSALISGTLKNGGFFDSNYYYIDLGSYSNKESLQNQVYKAYQTKGGFGIWYENCSWSLDQNKDGQHISIEPQNVSKGISLSSLVGEKFTFKYDLDSNGNPVLTIFPGEKSWLVILMTPQGKILKSTEYSTLHTSLAYSYSYQ